MRIFLALTLALSTLYGCAIHTPSGSVIVDPVDRPSSGGSGGGFCPPGQAKKGRC